MRTIALIPARAGSRRIPSKNIRDFCGNPLIAWTIKQAFDTAMFDNVFVSTNDTRTAEIAFMYGAIPILRPDDISQDESTDYEWVVHALENIHIINGKKPEYVAILRPTSPFRSVSTIVWGLSLLEKDQKWDSVRAIRTARSHPCKMWNYHKFIDGSGQITPLLPIVDRKTRCYDLPTQAFSQVWEQTGGLQVHRVSSIGDGDLSGQRICGIMQEEPESIDLNTQSDWEYAEWLVKSGKVKLPTID